MKRTWCDRCKEEIIGAPIYGLSLPPVTQIPLRDEYELCKKCLDVTRQVLRNECTIIVGERK